MTGLDFVAALVRAWVDLLTAVAWPVAGVAIALIFKREIHRLLHDLRSLKMGPFDAHFRQEMNEAQEIATEISAEAGPSVMVDDSAMESFIKLDQLAMNAHPTGVIMESWKGVESMLNAVAVKSQLAVSSHSPNVIGITGERPKKYLPLPERVLSGKGLINYEEAKLIEKLRNIRNQVAHYRNLSLSANEVREYVSLAQTAERFLAPLLHEQSRQPLTK